MCAGVGSGGGFRKFRKKFGGFGVCWCMFRKQVREGSAVSSEGLGRFRRVPESSGACWCRFRRQGSEGSGEFRCGLLPCNFDSGSHVIVLITLW